MQQIDYLGTASEENEYFEEITESIYKEILIKEESKEIILDLKEFNKQHKAIKPRIILYSIKKLLGSSQGIGKIHLQDIIDLCQNNIGNKYLTPNKHLKVYVNRGKMYFFVTQKT